MNEAIRNQLQILSGNGEPNSYNDFKNPHIENAGSITLSRIVISNLHQQMGNFSIRNSGKLILDRDVDNASMDCINSIVNTSSGIIKSPRSIYHLILIKSQNLGSLEIY